MPSPIVWLPAVACVIIVAAVAVREIAARRARPARTKAQRLPVKIDMPRSGITQRPWAVMFIVAAVVVAASSPRRGLVVTLVALAVGIAFVGSARTSLVAVTAAVPYAIGAYVGALSDIRFYPRPDLNGYWVTSREQLVGLLLTCALLVATGIGAAFEQRLRAALAGVAAGRPPDRAFRLARLIALGVGAHEVYVFARYANAILSGPRHAYQHYFLMGNGTAGIILALCLSTVLVVDLLVRRTRRLLVVALLAILWVPSVLAGERNYFSASMAIALVVFLLTTRRRSVRAAAIAAACGGIALLVHLPSYWAGASLDSNSVAYNEWILPNSTFLPMRLGVFDRADLGVTPLWQQWQLLLPHQLRFEHMSTLAPQFQSLTFTNVGVGGNPWADLFVRGAAERVILFSILTCAIFGLAVLLSRLSPLTPLIAFGAMLFWGRSVFWGMVTLVLYSGLTTWLLLYALRARRAAGVRQMSAAALPVSTQSVPS